MHCFGQGRAEEISPLLNGAHVRSLYRLALGTPSALHAAFRCDWVSPCAFPLLPTTYLPFYFYSMNQHKLVICWVTIRNWTLLCTLCAHGNLQIITTYLWETRSFGTWGNLPKVTWRGSMRVKSCLLKPQSAYNCSGRCLKDVLTAAGRLKFLLKFWASKISSLSAVLS